MKKQFKYEDFSQEINNDLINTEIISELNDEDLKCRISLINSIITTLKLEKKYIKEHYLK